MSFFDRVLFRSTPESLSSLLQDKKVFMIIDRNVEALYGSMLPYPKVFIDASEEKKNIETVEYIVEQLLQMGADRDCFLVGMGGGITTDIVGFVAAIYKRGVKYALIPTTLLAQVDASVGGKTGINAMGYKNIIGVFGYPEFVYNCSFFIKSLSDLDFRCGMSEMLKIFLSSDKKLYNKAINYFLNHPEFNWEERDEFEELVEASVRLKCEIVDDDFRESGRRRILNLGHTIGHAIEKCLKGTISHGEAVSIGIAYAARVSFNLGLTTAKTMNKIISDLNSVGLPTTTTVPEGALFAAMEKDKKREDNSIYFVVPIKIGSAEVIKMPISKIREVASAE